MRIIIGKVIAMLSVTYVPINENIKLRNELKDTRNSRFKLVSKLEALNNYITFLEIKIRG